MRVGVIGAGNMGSAFARRLSAAGHEVFIASRELADAEQAASSAGGSVRAVPQAELAGRAEVLIAATPFAQQAEAIRESGSIDGKVVIEISNPMKEDMSGLAVGLDTSAAEEVSLAVPKARVVKAFNTVFAQVLSEQPSGHSDREVQVFYASDDEGAKGQVHGLIESMGFEPVDAGPLANARYLEPMGMLNIYFGYMAERGTAIAPQWQEIDAKDAKNE